MFKPSRLLDNLRQFRYPNLLPLSSSWPVHRRSAVLILLFVGPRGELRVLLTKRSKGLSSFPGHISLPGGKADTVEESFEGVARREAEEEIGLPQDAEILQQQFGMAIENTCKDMPCYLSRTFLSVKPLVCFLHTVEQSASDADLPLDGRRFTAALDPGETSSIFSVPLLDMIAHLLPKHVKYREEYIDFKTHFPQWGGLKWPLRHYYYPAENPFDVDWLNDIQDNSSCDELERTQGKRDLWGLTANILYDVARIAQGIVTSKDGSFDIGHEELIYGLKEFGGQLQPGKRSIWETAMMHGTREYKFSDVITPFYMEKLNKISPKY
ncbi:PCD1 (YLR151C) [Zygosaccharomyces parabailii]|nr:PCD1 (YLR151C) [Zygosaccharomyces parabailii]CDH10487.1 related to Peroxisomal coenzyme A diphosphatase 1, peroxisomal [Zygosaccharomyces bailii ISA1307]